MSRIDELIRELCPEGVVFKHLWEITIWDKRFNSVEKSKQIKTIKVPHVSAKKLKEIEAVGDVKLLSTGKFDGWTNDEQAASSLGQGEVITIPSGGSANLKYWSGKFVDSGNLLATSSDTSKYNLKYIYYFLLSKNNFVESCFRGSGVKHPDMGQILEIKVPTPPIEVQKEIVNILDKFTQLEAELSAELEARQKQYEYYRKQLLTFDESVVPFSDLGDVYKFQYGKGNTIPTAGGDYPVYGSNGVVGSHHEYNSEDAPVIGHIGAYAGIVNWGEGKHFVTYNGVICQIKSGIDDRFGYHLLMKQNLRELARDGSQPFVSYDKLNSVKVQIPDIDTQKQIAKILDGFDLLTNGISEGLPAEINARRKQYEYYRTKLLTFQELSA